MADFIDDIKNALDEKERKLYSRQPQSCGEFESAQEPEQPHSVCFKCGWTRNGHRPMNRLTCPSCETVFPLRWEGDKPDTIEVCSCLSGGVYAISIQCPGCGYKEEVF